MKRFFVMRRFTGIGLRPMYVMDQHPDSALYFHRRIYSPAGYRRSVLAEIYLWARTFPGSYETLVDPAKWVEIASDKFEDLWSHLNVPYGQGDILEDPVIFAAQVGNPTSRPPNKTSNTKHKIGVPKNKLP